MSEETKVPETAEYRAELMQRAEMLGLTIHPNAKNETIAAKIAAALAKNPEEVTEVVTTSGETIQVKEKEMHPTKRLHRVIVTCNDPQKSDQTGDIISVSNGEVGALRFYFHFNKPWHIPEIILETMKEAKLFLHSSRKDGKEIVAREVPRYNIQYLPALNEKERERIAAKQSAALASED